MDAELDSHDEPTHHDDLARDNSHALTHDNPDAQTHRINDETHENNDEMAQDITHDNINTPPTTQSNELTHNKYETELTHNNSHSVNETESIGNVQESQY